MNPGKTVPILAGIFPRLDPIYQLYTAPILAAAGSKAKPALPALYAALEKTLHTKLLPMGFGACGTPPRPEYDEIELMSGAAVIRAILAINPDERVRVIWKLVEVFRSGNAGMNHFAWRELSKLNAEPILKAEFGKGGDPAIKKALSGLIDPRFLSRADSRGFY